MVCLHFAAVKSVIADERGQLHGCSRIAPKGVKAPIAKREVIFGRASGGFYARTGFSAVHKESSGLVRHGSFPFPRSNPR
jgi:hypothetical protein